MTGESISLTITAGAAELVALGITAGATLGLCFLIWWQTRLVGRSTKEMEKSVDELKKTREGATLLEVHRLVREFVHPARESIFQATRDAGEKLQTFRKKLYASGVWRKDAWDLAYAWNVIAALCKQGLVSPKPMIAFYPQLIEQCWWILEPTIQTVRAERSPDNSKPFEWLVKQARAGDRSDAVDGPGAPSSKEEDGVRRPQ